jgi:phospholipid/cholesterol/gamma-HCH transport system substrate-binding protein
METRANYLLVGGFVIGLMVALVVFVIWIAKFQFDAKFAQYEILFEGSVSGLKVGSVVSYRGIDVGEVKEIRIDPSDLDHIPVLIEIQATTPVRTDTVAKLQMQGITGGSYVLLTGGDQSAPPLEATPGHRYPVIPSQESGLAKLLEGAPEVVDNVNELILKATTLLSDENRKAITGSLQDIQTLTSAIAGRKGDIEEIISNTSGTLESLRQTADALQGVSAKVDDTLGTISEAVGTADGAVSQVSTQLDALITEFKKTAEAFTGVGTQVEALVAENRGPLRDFSATGLYELSRVLAELRDLILTLNRVTTQVERDPGLFFFGDQQQGYETSR